MKTSRIVISVLTALICLSCLVFTGVALAMPHFGLAIIALLCAVGYVTAKAKLKRPRPRVMAKPGVWNIGSALFNKLSAILRQGRRL